MHKIDLGCVEICHSECAALIGLGFQKESRKIEGDSERGGREVLGTLIETV